MGEKPVGRFAKLGKLDDGLDVLVGNVCWELNIGWKEEKVADACVTPPS